MVKRRCAGRRNRGLEVAQGETILFCDNDVVFTPRWRSLMLNHMEAADIGVVGFGDDYTGAQKSEELPGDNETLAQFRTLHFHAGEHQYTMRLILFCMMVRRDVIDKIGGFDQGFGQWGFEDDDFTICEAGFSTVLGGSRLFHTPYWKPDSQTAKLNYQISLF